MHGRWLVVVLVLALSWPACVAAGNTRWLFPSHDTTIYEPLNAMATPLSNGAGSFLFTGRTGLDGGFTARRALIRFDLESQLPAGVTIVEAELRLVQSKAAPLSPPAEIGLYRLNAEWGEADSNATGPEGQGAEALTGDATWTHRLHPDSAWSTPGGDFGPSASAVTTVGQALQQYTWACSATMVSDLNQWMALPESNHGWILLGGEDSGKTGHRFNSRDNAAPETWPVLVVRYVPDDELFADGFESPACQQENAD